MNIIEAIKATTIKHPYITRKAWDRITSKPCDAAIKIQPTDSPDGCIVISVNLQECVWQPSAADLIADDWRLAS